MSQSDQTLSRFYPASSLVLSLWDIQWEFPTSELACWWCFYRASGAKLEEYKHQRLKKNSYFHEGGDENDDEIREDLSVRAEAEIIGQIQAETQRETLIFHSRLFASCPACLHRHHTSPTPKPSISSNWEFSWHGQSSVWKGNIVQCPDRIRRKLFGVHTAKRLNWGHTQPNTHVYTIEPMATLLYSPLSFTESHTVCVGFNSNLLSA